MTVTVDTATPTPAAAPVEALIALTKLSVAPETVRCTDRRGGVEGLAENIAREGLLQNLVFETQPGAGPTRLQRPAASRARHVAPGGGQPEKDRQGCGSTSPRRLQAP